MIFKTEYIPLLEDFDKKGHLTLGAILKFLENAGSRHSDAAKDSTLEVRESQGVAWVLTDWKVKVLEFPVYGKTLEVQTWSEGLSSPFSTNRNFYMKDKEKLCVEGTTKWVRMDINSGRPVKVTEDLLLRYGPEPEKKVFNGEKIQKIESPENFSSETKIALRRTDFDFNNHVHNLNYLDFALEALPQEVYESTQFTSVRISYKAALKEGGFAVCKHASANGKHTVCIYSQEGVLACLVELSI